MGICRIYKPEKWSDEIGKVVKGLFIRNFLKAFYDTTKASEGRDATIDHILLIMDFLLERYETAAKTFQDDQFMAACMTLDGLNSEYTSTTPIDLQLYIAAIVLNPVRKGAFFDDWDFAWNLEAKASMKRFWEQKY